MKNIFGKVTPVLKDTAENVSSSVKTFVEGMNEEITKKTLFGKYVVSPVEITNIQYMRHGCIYNHVEDLCGESYMMVFTFSTGRKFSIAYYSTPWSILAVGDVCSYVQKFNRKGQLTFEEFMPVPPENVCYCSMSGKPYYREW